LEIIARLANLPGALPGACAQGLIWGIMAIGVYLTYRILDVADLTVDGSFGTGGAVCVMCLLSGQNVWVSLLMALLAGLLSGFVTGVLHTFMGIPAILAGILTQLSLYSINLKIMGKANQAINVDKYNLLIGERTAEQIKIEIGSAYALDPEMTMEIKGRSLLTGLPVRVNVSTDDLYDPVMMLSEQIGAAAHQVLEKTPPELAGDIFRNGVMLTGGGAQLHGLTEYLSEELKVEVTVSPDPVNCVALGTAMSLGLNDKLETGFLDATPRIGRR